MSESHSVSFADAVKTIHRLCQQNDPIQAIDFAQQWMQGHGTHPYVLCASAKAYIAAKAYGQATAAYDAAEKLLPFDSHILGERSDFEGQFGSIPKSQAYQLKKEHCQQAADIAADLANASMRKMPKDTIRKGMVWLKEHGLHPAVLMEVAAAHTSLNQPTLADALYRQILTIDPHNERLNYQLGEMAWKNDQPEEAARHFNAMVPVDMRMVEAQHCSLGQLAIERKDFRKAKTHFTEVLSAYGSNRFALCGMGIAERHLGEPHRARRYFEQVLEKNPAHHMATFYLALLDLDERNPASAIQRLTHAQKMQFNAHGMRILHRLAKQGIGTNEYRELLDTLKTQKPSAAGEYDCWSIDPSIRANPAPLLTPAVMAEIEAEAGHYARSRIFAEDSRIPEPIDRVAYRVAKPPRQRA